jgi:hypothetical protein
VRVVSDEHIDDDENGGDGATTIAVSTTTGIRLKKRKTYTATIGSTKPGGAPDPYSPPAKRRRGEGNGLERGRAREGEASRGN